MPREDLVNLLEDLGIRTASGFVAREIEQLTRPDGQVSLPRSRSHIFARATQGRLAIPAWNEFTSVITDIAESVRRDVTGGANADYIQVLRDADPTKFAVSVVTVDGQRFNYGDFSHSYSIQSCSKPLTYAIAVDEAGGASGLPFVHSHVGSEASGLAFNSISVNDAGLPHNPMVNAGAIAAVGLVGRHCPDLSSRFAYLMSRYRDVAGDTEVGFSQATYLCELETAWRNNAILYTLSEAGVFNKRTHPYATLDLYIQACATEVNTETAAMIAATFANGGIQPISGKRVLSSAAVKAALTLCFSCGLYDGSGTWAVNVGLPAKSGVAGLIYVIIPGVAGVAVFSPPLDQHGNSVRGVAFCERLVRTFPFGLFDKAVSDVLSDLSPPSDPHMLYLPPHLRRARAVMEAVRSRRRKVARRAARLARGGRAAAASASSGSLPGFDPGASLASQSTLATLEATAGHESDDSDDESGWAEMAVARALAMGIDVDHGIDYSAAFRLIEAGAGGADGAAGAAEGGGASGPDDDVSLNPVAPALLLSHSLAASHSHAGSSTPLAGAGSADGSQAGGKRGPGLGRAASDGTPAGRSGRDTSRQGAFTSEAIRFLHSRLGARHVLRHLGKLWVAFRSLRDWAPGSYDVRMSENGRGRGRGTARSAGTASQRTPGGTGASSASRGGNGASAAAAAAAAGLAATDRLSGSHTSVRRGLMASPGMGTSFRGGGAPAMTVRAGHPGGGGPAGGRDPAIAESFPDVDSVPRSAIEAWRLASFLASKGMACTHAQNARVASLLDTLSGGSGIVRFQDLILSPAASADTLLLRALLGTLVVDDFEGVRHSIKGMAQAVLQYVPPVPVRRDGTVPPSAVAEFNSDKRRRDDESGAAAESGAAGSRPASRHRRNVAGTPKSGATSAGGGGSSSAGVEASTAALGGEEDGEEDAEAVLREAEAKNSAADPLHDLKRGMSAAEGSAPGGAVPPDQKKSKVDEHRDSLDKELKAVSGIDPSTFGVALCTCDGQYACMGDYDKKVPIMETVFPLLYAMAMEDSGAEAVNAWAGTEPSSHPPDSFTLMDPAGGGHGGGGEDDEGGNDDDEALPGRAGGWASLPEDVRVRAEVKAHRRIARDRRERRRRRRMQRKRWRDMRSRGGREALQAEKEEAEMGDSETTDSDIEPAVAGGAGMEGDDFDSDSGADDAKPSRPAQAKPAPGLPALPAGAGLALDLSTRRGPGGAPVLAASGPPDMERGDSALAIRTAGLPDAVVPPATLPASRPMRGVAGTGSAVLHDAEAMGGVDASRDPKGMPSPSHVRPYNACTLAGALTVMACVGRGHLRKRERLFKDSGSRFTHVVSRLQSWAGDARLGFNNAACLLLKQRALRCMALSHYLKGMEALPPRSDPTDIAQALVQCMSIEATVRQLATIAATFARAGACPTTDRRCMRPSTVKNTLSMTYTCGMGPLSGTWTFNIALPATVGSTGVTLVVIPGLGGLALLDGTADRLTPACPMPARSLKFCEMLVRQFRVNMFDALITPTGGSPDGSQLAASSDSHASGKAGRRPDVSSTLLSFELTTAAGEGDMDRVVSLIKMGADVATADYDARSALHIACCEGHLDVVAVLVRHGADALTRDRWGQSPFAEAVRCGHRHIVTFLEGHLVSMGQQPPTADASAAAPHP